jgi:hypothetical protein
MTPNGLRKHSHWRLAVGDVVAEKAGRDDGDNARKEEVEVETTRENQRVLDRTSTLSSVQDSVAPEPVFDLAAVFAVLGCNIVIVSDGWTADEAIEKTRLPY